ncbi:unnamed protein product [Lepidochelys olivacea]
MALVGNKTIGIKAPGALMTQTAYDKVLTGARDPHQTEWAARSNHQRLSSSPRLALQKSCPSRLRPSFWSQQKRAQTQAEEMELTQSVREKIYGPRWIHRISVTSHVGWKNISTPR